MARIIKYLIDGDYRFMINAHYGLYKSMPDEMYLKRIYKAKMGKELDLDQPKTMNEKLQWLKVHDRNPLYSTLVDKYEVKAYVGDHIGYEHIIPTLGIWESFYDINFDLLPDKFVLKGTHDSHACVICRDKALLDMKEARVKMSRSLKRNYYYAYREWPYKDVKPRIIAEEYLEDESGFLTDYKFYCFNGKVDCVLTCFDRMSGDTKFYFFDRNWELKRYNKQGKEAPEGFTKPKPAGMDEMFDLAEVLGKASGAPFVRVDFYNVYGKIYFGELTLYPAAGFDTGRLPETDLLFGEMIDLNTVRRQ